MLGSKTATRTVVAALATAAVTMTGAPAIATSSAKPPFVPTGTLDAPVGGITDITQQNFTVAAGNTDKYSYDNEIIYWSVTAVRPGAGNRRANIELFADAANTQSLTSSRLLGNNVDFVAVNSNYAPAPKTRYPTVSSAGSGAYYVQNDTDENVLVCEQFLPVTMAADDVVFIADVFGRAGTHITISATGGGDGQLFLMHTSKPNRPSNWYQARKQAIKVSDGAAGAEEISFVGDGTYYGLVLVQNSGSGTYTLHSTCT